MAVILVCYIILLIFVIKFRNIEQEKGAHALSLSERSKAN